MYGYIAGGNNPTADDFIFKDNEEFEQLKSQYPEHEVYLFVGKKMDMALFLAPGISAMLIETRGSPDEIC